MIVNTEHRFSVLIAAHGSRDSGNSNENIFHLAEKVAARIGEVPLGVGFIKGVPTIGDAVEALDATNIIVYPLFMAAGYFGGTVFNRLVEDARRTREGCSIIMLPPLGLDPALADLVVAKAASAAQSHGMSMQQTSLVLLAHGSSRSRESALATERIAKRAREHQVFDNVCVAFLDEAPPLEAAVAELTGPIAVVGLFADDGLHGENDARRLMSQLARDDAIYVGNVGLISGLEQLIAAAVSKAIAVLDPNSGCA